MANPSSRLLANCIMNYLFTTKECRAPLTTVWGKLNRRLQQSGITNIYILQNFLCDHSGIFILNDNPQNPFVSMKTDLILCPAHSNKAGSCPEGNCNGLHMCIFYLLSGNCHHGERCHFGHNLTTQHNSVLLKRCWLDHLTITELRMLLTLPFNRHGVTQPRVCKYYNVHKGCSKGEQCRSLHICKPYVMKDCKFGTACRRNHNIDDQVRKILTLYGVNISRPPKDILMELNHFERDNQDDMDSYDNEPGDRRNMGTPQPPHFLQHPNSPVQRFGSNFEPECGQNMGRPYHPQFAQHPVGQMQRFQSNFEPDFGQNMVRPHHPQFAQHPVGQMQRFGSNFEPDWGQNMDRPHHPPWPQHPDGQMQRFESNFEPDYRQNMNRPLHPPQFVQQQEYPMQKFGTHETNYGQNMGRPQQPQFNQQAEGSRQKFGSMPDLFRGKELSLTQQPSETKPNNTRQRTPSSDARQRPPGDVRQRTPSADTRKRRGSNDIRQRQKTTPKSKILFPQNAEICVGFLMGICKYGDKCRNMHMKKTFQWQFALINKPNVWQDFDDITNLELEKTFSQPDMSEWIVDLKNPKSLQLKVLFNKMEAVDTDADKYLIRRLSTPSRMEHSMRNYSPAAPILTTWLWYWRDDEKQWHEFGNESILRLPITSDEIEQQHLNNSESRIPIVNSSYLLKLDKMNLKETNSKSLYKIRRRPFFQQSNTELPLRTSPSPRGKQSNSPGGKVSAKTAISDVKSESKSTVSRSNHRGSQEMIAHFSTMALSDGDVEEDITTGSLLSKLTPNSNEYEEVKKTFTQTIGKQSVVLCIHKIENPSQFENFAKKKKAMMSKSKGKPVEVRTLYYGPSPDENIEAICSQGINCSDSPAAADLQLGRGGYFFNSASKADKYNERAPERHVFMVDCLVGVSGKGIGWLTTPPFNENNDLCDSCVDDPLKPKIFVIFDSSQVHLKYLITYKCM